MRRRTIVDAARRCYTRDSIAATTITDVAKESRLTVRAVLAQFPTSEDILREVATTMMSQRLQIMEELTERRPVLAPAELLREVAHSAGIRSQAALRIHDWSAYLRDPELSEAIADYAASMDGLLSGYAQAWLESIGRSSAEAADGAGSIATTLHVLINGAVVQVAIDQTMTYERVLDAVGAIDFAPRVAAERRRPRRPSLSG